MSEIKMRFSQRVLEFHQSSKTKKAQDTLHSPKILTYS
jgi:hypothetical protein